MHTVLILVAKRGDSPCFYTLESIFIRVPTA